MKGVVFVELLAMAEEAFGEDAVDEVIDNADLHNGGSYTAVGNYPCEELVKIVEAFSAYSGLDADVLQRKFGHWMMGFFSRRYPEFFVGKSTAFEMLEAVDQEIHVEVLKLYPDAELPAFQTERRGDGRLDMIYTSPRPLVPFCHGLIEACVESFEEKATVTSVATPNTTNSTTFTISVVGS